MGDLNFKFTDAQVISDPTAEDKELWKDSFGASYTSDSKVLRVKFEATHSALINRNRRWYSPSRMRDGAHTFVSKKKPAKVLKHHDTMSDPVGIVRDYSFIETVPEDLMDNSDVATLLSSTADMKDQIKAMKNLISSGVTTREGYKGLGYISLDVDIMDRTAIEQVSNGLFDAVSTSFNSPNEAYCFICGHNWGQDGPCEHEDLWEQYKDENEVEWPMMLIPGNHDYEEVSLVVKDADPFSAISINDSVEGGYSKVVEYHSDWRKDNPTYECKFEFKDSIEEDNNMAKKKNNSVELSDEAKAVLELIKSFRPDGEEKILADFAIKIADLQLEDGAYPSQKEAGIDEETAVKYALEDLETSEEEIDAEEVYAEMEKEFDELIKDEAFTEDQISDAKLSSETRKKLSASTFCGPNRSFPVPDCAHVTAAKRLIGRYKGPGNKTEILACVAKKEKALGCGSKNDSVEPKQDNTEVFKMPSCECLAAADNEEALALFAKAEAELISRKLKADRECSKCSDYLADKKVSEEAAAKMKDEVEELKVTLSVLRNELKFQQADYVHQVDENIDLEAKMRKIKEEKLAIVGTLVGKYKSTKDAEESFKSSDLKSLEASIMDSFDIEAITGKLNNGMTKEPESGDLLTNPSVITDGDNPSLPEGLTGPALAVIDNVKYFISKGDEGSAKQLFHSMKHKGIIPDGFEFDKFQQEDVD